MRRSVRHFGSRTPFVIASPPSATLKASKHGCWGHCPLARATAVGHLSSAHGGVLPRAYPKAVGHLSLAHGGVLPWGWLACARAWDYVCAFPGRIKVRGGRAAREDGGET